MTPIFFLSLLAFASSDLIIDIDVTNGTKPFIDVRGSISTTVISDAERKTFGIEDAALIKAFETYTNDGTVPNYVYVKKTGEENDLYVKYKDWLEVQRTVKPNYLDIVPNPKCVTVDYPAVESVNKKIEIKWTHWPLHGNLSVVDKITHILYLDEGKKMTVISKWGKNNSTEESVAIEKDHVYRVCEMKFEINYDATIAGDVTADYTKKRQDKHHFWAYDLEDVQDAAKLEKKVVTTEEVTVSYYYKSKKINPKPENNMKKRKEVEMPVTPKKIA